MNTIRALVQTIFALLVNSSWSFPVTRTIYQGPLKVICSPGLNCYSCPASSTYCAIGSLQQLFGGIRMALENGQFFFGFYVIGSIGVFGGFVGRMVCGWACPFGLFQEILHKIPSPKFNVPRPLRYFKYVLLALMVVILPLFAVNEYGMGETWFCKYFCPAGTLEAGLPMLLLQPDMRRIVGTLFFSKLFILVVFVIWSVLASRPFCRTSCPLGAFYALFSKVKLVRLQLNENRCIRCEACHKVCPMGVKFNQSPNDAECISCLNCKKICPVDAISLDMGALTVIPTTVEPTKIKST